MLLCFEEIGIISSVDEFAMLLAAACMDMQCRCVYVDVSKLSAFKEISKSTKNMHSRLSKYTSSHRTVRSDDRAILSSAQGRLESGVVAQGYGGSQPT